MLTPLSWGRERDTVVGGNARERMSIGEGRGRGGEGGPELEGGQRHSKGIKGRALE
jgi:hypothetical protein